MKRKRKISEERILQISNDISEDMCNATKAELIEVVNYWRDEVDRTIQKYAGFRHSMAGALAGFTGALVSASDEFSLAKPSKK